MLEKCSRRRKSFSENFDILYAYIIFYLFRFNNFIYLGNVLKKTPFLPPTGPAQLPGQATAQSPAAPEASPLRSPARACNRPPPRSATDRWGPPVGFVPDLSPESRTRTLRRPTPCSTRTPPSPCPSPKATRLYKPRPRPRFCLELRPPSLELAITAGDPRRRPAPPRHSRPTSHTPSSSSRRAERLDALAAAGDPPEPPPRRRPSRRHRLPRRRRPPRRGNHRLSPSFV